MAQGTERGERRGRCGSLPNRYSQTPRENLSILTKASGQGSGYSTPERQPLGKIDASRPPAFLQRLGRISRTGGAPARRSHSRGRLAAPGPAPTPPFSSRPGEVSYGHFKVFVFCLL